MKKYLPLLLIFAFVGYIIRSCNGPSPCECASDFELYSKLYLPTESDKEKISDCMELYYEETGIKPKADPNTDFISAYYYFGNHPCHDK